MSNFYETNEYMKNEVTLVKLVDELRKSKNEFMTIKNLAESEKNTFTEEEIKIVSNSIKRLNENEIS